MPIFSFSPCLLDQQSLDQLSDEQVFAKQAKIQQVGYWLLLLLVLFVGMAFIVNSYLVAASSWALIPALADYRKKYKAINGQLQKRNLA